MLLPVAPATLLFYFSCICFEVTIHLAASTRFKSHRPAFV